MLLSVLACDRFQNLLFSRVSGRESFRELSDPLKGRSHQDSGQNLIICCYDPLFTMGTLIEIRVPCPGSESMKNVPPASSTRSFIPKIPSPFRIIGGEEKYRFTSKPFPSSVIYK